MIIRLLLISNSDFILQGEDVITNIQNNILDMKAEIEKLTESLQTSFEEHESKQKHIDVSAWLWFAAHVIDHHRRPQRVGLVIERLLLPVRFPNWQYVVVFLGKTPHISH